MVAVTEESGATDGTEATDGAEAAEDGVRVVVIIIIKINQCLDYFYCTVSIEISILCVTTIVKEEDEKIFIWQ